ncbi:putative RNA polymerase II subunit B1 CTD phosphatase RPAP2 homolog [Bidens hawaiensis]|uniref:putative RNA polymerase II subunit B1 CTD phosphatase RPAP2 homolog n=1 Tax=Bidens hawaiensis TaxID=980011 RepID=UPI00404ACAE6
MSNPSSSSPSTTPLKDAIYKLQLHLLDGITSKTQLTAAGSLLSKPDYHDVITERSIAKTCGYPLCTNPLPSPEPKTKGRYRISLKEHKVYDMLETHMYCSTKCLSESRAFAASLVDERVMQFDGGKVEKVMKVFDESGISGVGGVSEFGFGKLSIKENGDRSVVAVEEWVGPSDAVEGYVPRASLKNNKSVKDGKLKWGGNEEEGLLNFTSCIITQEDKYSKPCGQTKENNAKDGKLKRDGNEKESLLNFTSCIITQEDGYSKPRGQTKENKRHTKLKVEEESKVGLKSCMKSEPSAARRNVTWADDDNNNNQTQVSKNDKEIDKVEEQLAVAEVRAKGEPQNVAASKVLEAGAEPAQLKGPKVTGIVEPDFFNYEDSWFDTTPEEFVVNLSTFATMFMSLFAWVSSSTLAFVYGGEDSDDYASINGREYPQKIVLSDGRSSEIKQTLAACLARALPGLVLHLRLATPLSTIESGMACLLETMSFVDPLPALRIKQWHVFLLLFLEALSVSRIPALAPHLTANFFHKVLEDGQISREEYEVLKDLILPLGRFAMQSGA